jgi:hypothetical protein
VPVLGPTHEMLELVGQTACNGGGGAVPAAAASSAHHKSGVSHAVCVQAELRWSGGKGAAWLRNVP